MSEREFNLIIIGSGSAGSSAAEAAKTFGMKRVAIVEGRDRLGGECPNRGCVPSKALLRATEILEFARRADEYGLVIPKVDFDFVSIMQRKRDIVDKLTAPPRLEDYFKNLGIEVLRGWAKFIDPHTIEIRGARYQAEKCIIATGSETFIPPIPGLVAAPYIASDDFMELTERPNSIAIVGGGPIGVESAQFLAALGTEVTVVEFMPQILPREDEEIAAVLVESLTKRGIKILTNTKVEKVKKRGAEIVVTVAAADSSRATKLRTQNSELRTQTLMLATGKRPTVGILGLEKLGMQLDTRGGPVTNEFLQTSIPHIYLAGDVSGHLLFTHTSHYEGEIAARNAATGNTVPIDLRVVPRGTFTRPEVGSVGLTEREARTKGYEVGIGKVPYRALGKALVARELEGLVKIVVDKKTKQVLGGHVIGEVAAEIVHEVALAMAANIPYTVMADMIHAYPTYAESIGAAAFAVE